MVLAVFSGGFGFIIVIAALLFLLLPILALISIIRNEFEGNNKLIWIVLVIFLPYLGSIIYFLIGRNQRLRR